MDLVSLAVQLGQQAGTQNKTAAKELLPPQQQSRSYQDEPSVEYADVIRNVTRFRFGEIKGKWVVQYKIDYPIGGTKPTQQQVMAFAKDYLASNTDKQDLKYIKITQADEYNIEYTFDHETWFKDTMSQKPQYYPPVSLRWHYTKTFPRIIFVNNNGFDLKKFVQRKFEEWIDSRPTLLKNEKFKFIEKIAAKLFDFKWDYVGQCMYAHMKYSVILGSLALYMSLYHDKDAKTTDIKKIQQQAANFGDVKKLDKYIKKLK